MQTDTGADAPKHAPTKLSDLPFQALGGQPAFDPDELERFVSAARIAILAYARRDGTPNQVPIWYSYERGRFLMVSTTTSPKVLATKRAPRVTLTIQDEAPPYRAVTVEGTVAFSETPVTGGLSTRLARRYFGRIGGNEYESMTRETYEQSGLTLMTLTPDRVRGFDNTNGLGRATVAFLRFRALLPIPDDWI